VGLTPKLYCRVLRFHHAIEQAGSVDRGSWAELALGAGYADQPHFNRDFREFAGVTPSRYRELAPVHSHHVPILGRADRRPEVNSVQANRNGRSQDRAG
jgi:AraC-like DNA-binding protein